MRQLIGKFSLLLASSAALFCGIAACGSQTETITWKEEVALHDGRTIIVTRSVTLGGGRKEPGAHTVGESNYTLDFTAPDGRSIHWENPGRLRLMALGFVGSIPYLLTTPAMVLDYARYNCPNPAYVFYKYMNGWQRIEFGDFPSAIRVRNLSPSSNAADVFIRGGHVSSQEIKELSDEYSGLGKGDRKLDPKEQSPEGCANTKFLD